MTPGESATGKKEALRRGSSESCWRTALVGLGFWVGCAALYSTARLELIELLLLFGPLVAVPGGLSMVLGRRGETRLWGEAVVVHLLLPAALCVIASRALGPYLASSLALGLELSAVLTLPWFLVTALVALLGVQRLLRRGLSPIEETTIDVGLLYLPVGGGWLLLSSAGLEPMGFDATIVLLTAVHFHFAGFSAAVIAGLAGRAFRERGSANEGVKTLALAAYRFAATIVIFGPPLVAVGIMASPIVEVISGIALSIGMLTLAFVLVLVALTGSPLLPRLLLCVAALSLTATMALSMTYAAGEYVGDELVSIATMAATHGVVNVLGFTLCGGLGLILLSRGEDEHRAMPDFE
ncbi:MAG: YndJ family protein [Planctomycetota bacterium]|nr:YndJ family protein [Planctomycetota bacterium]